MALSARVPSFRIGTPRPAAGAAGAATIIALVGGLTGAAPPLVALAVAVAAPTGLVAVRLVRLALTIHSAQSSFGPCRGAGFLGMAALSAGLTTSALPVVPVSTRGGVAAAGLACAVAMVVLGLMLLPGAAVTTAARLRRGLDGLSITALLCYAGWVLLSPGRVPPLALVAGVLTALALAVLTVIALRAVYYRPAAGLCAAGAGTIVAGLAGVTVALAHGVSGRVILLGAVGLVLGPVLVWAGARRARAGPTRPEAGSETLASYPLLAVPVGLAVVVSVYHLVTVGDLDRVSTALGIVAGSLLAIREGLAAVDVRRYARRLARQEAHFRALAVGGHDLILMLDDELVVRWQSPTAARLFGLSDQDVLGRPFLARLHPDDIGAAGRVLGALVDDGPRPDQPGQPDQPGLVNARLRDGFGRWRDTESTVSDQRGTPEVDAIVLHLRDVGERRQLEQTLHRLAYTDQLTALPNRQELLRAITQRRAATGYGGALLVIDLHGLSAVNDEQGREVGDAVLVEVARRLRLAVGPDDVVARLAGDEFGVASAAGPMRAYALGTRLLTELTRPYEVPGAVVILHASIGLAEVDAEGVPARADDGADGDGDGMADVLKRADLARRRARQLGKDRLEWYDNCVEEQIVRRLDVERELPGAISRGELDLVFQPVVQLLDRRPVGIEALLRWRHPELGTVMPAELIPVADDTDAIDKIGEWVLRTACRHLASWREAGNDVWLAVNMSPRQLASPGFVGRVAGALSAYRLPAERLVIEVAEAEVGDNLPAVVTHLAGLRELGVRTALDDFGGGQASLANLRRLPVDILKIDGALISAPADRSGPTRPVIDVAVSLGRRLGMELIAEGLESPARLEEALGAGCRLGQGFLLARPAPAERLEAYLEDYRAPSL